MIVLPTRALRQALVGLCRQATAAKSVRRGGPKAAPSTPIDRSGIFPGPCRRASPVPGPGRSKSHLSQDLETSPEAASAGSASPLLPVCRPEDVVRGEPEGRDRITDRGECLVAFRATPFLDLEGNDSRCSSSSLNAVTYSFLLKKISGIAKDLSTVGSSRYYLLGAPRFPGARPSRCLEFAITTVYSYMYCMDVQVRRQSWKTSCEC